MRTKVGARAPASPPDNRRLPFTEFVRARSDKMLELTWLITRDAEDARDAVQDVLASLYPRWSTLPAGDEFEAYVYRSVVNACLRVIRRRGRSLPVAEPERLRSTPVVDDPSVEVGVRDQVWRLCGELEPRQRTAVILRFRQSQLRRHRGRDRLPRDHSPISRPPRAGADAHTPGGITMTDPTEQILRSGLAELVRDKPALGPIDLEAVTQSGLGRHGRGADRTHPPTTRWLMAAAVLVVLAGVGFAGWFGLSQGERATTAEPQATTAEPQATTAEPQVTTVKPQQRLNQLMGVRWLATQINDQPVRPETAGGVPYLIFESTQRVDGGDPCNELFGSYRLDGDQLRFQRLGVTQMSCGSSDREQQSAYASALEATTTVRREGSTLTLLDPAGAVVLVFQAAAERSPVLAKTLIRVRNDTAVDFARVEAVFPNDTKFDYGSVEIDYGSVEAGQSSGYGRVGEAYDYTYIRLQLADGRELVFQPDDYVGATLLAPGRYTYALRIEGSGSDAYVDLRLEADQ